MRGAEKLGLETPEFVWKSQEEERIMRITLTPASYAPCRRRERVSTHLSSGPLP